MRRNPYRDPAALTQRERDLAKTAGGAGNTGKAVGTVAGTAIGALLGGAVGSLAGGVGAVPGAGLGAGLGGTAGSYAGEFIGNAIGDAAQGDLDEEEMRREKELLRMQLRQEALDALKAQR